MNRVEQHLGLVRSIAKGLARAGWIDADDLYQEGVQGLIDADKRFDESKKVPFIPYAKFRIRGAMLDYLRREKPGTRDTPVKTEQIDDFHIRTLVDPRKPPDQIPVTSVTREFVEKLKGALTVRERELIELMYGPEQLNQAEAGRRMGLKGWGRMSQLHTNAMRKMRLLAQELGERPL